jgi:hypothetical protein
MSINRVHCNYTILSHNKYFVSPTSILVLELSPVPQNPSQTDRDDRDRVRPRSITRTRARTRVPDKQLLRRPPDFGTPLSISLPPWGISSSLTSDVTELVCNVLLLYTPWCCRNSNSGLIRTRSSCCPTCTCYRSGSSAVYSTVSSPALCCSRCKDCKSRDLRWRDYGQVRVVNRDIASRCSRRR